MCLDQKKKRKGKLYKVAKNDCWQKPSTMMLTSYFSYGVCCDTLKNNMTQEYYLPEQDFLVVIHKFRQKHGNGASKYPWTGNV